MPMLYTGRPLVKRQFLPPTGSTTPTPGLPAAPRPGALGGQSGGVLSSSGVLTGAKQAPAPAPTPQPKPMAAPTPSGIQQTYQQNVSLAQDTVRNIANSPYQALASRVALQELEAQLQKDQRRAEGTALQDLTNRGLLDSTIAAGTMAGIEQQSTDRMAQARIAGLQGASALQLQGLDALRGFTPQAADLLTAANQQAAMVNDAANAAVNANLRQQEITQQGALGQGELGLRERAQINTEMTDQQRIDLQAQAQQQDWEKYLLGYGLDERQVQLQEKRLAQTVVPQEVGQQYWKALGLPGQYPAAGMAMDMLIQITQNDPRLLQAQKDARIAQLRGVVKSEAMNQLAVTPGMLASMVPTNVPPDQRQQMLNFLARIPGLTYKAAQEYIAGQLGNAGTAAGTAQTAAATRLTEQQVAQRDVLFPGEVARQRFDTIGAQAQASILQSTAQLKAAGLPDELLALRANALLTVAQAQTAGAQAKYAEPMAQTQVRLAQAQAKSVEDLGELRLAQADLAQQKASLEATGAKNALDAQKIELMKSQIDFAQAKMEMMAATGDRADARLMLDTLKASMAPHYTALEMYQNQLKMIPIGKSGAAERTRLTGLVNKEMAKIADIEKQVKELGTGIGVLKGTPTATTTAPATTSKLGSTSASTLPGKGVAVQEVAPASAPTATFKDASPQDLTDTVRAALNQGASEQSIRTTLAKNGVPATAINNAIKAAKRK